MKTEPGKEVYIDLDSHNHLQIFETSSIILFVSNSFDGNPDIL